MSRKFERVSQTSTKHFITIPEGYSVKDINARIKPLLPADAVISKGHYSDTVIEYLITHLPDGADPTSEHYQDLCFYLIPFVDCFVARYHWLFRKLIPATHIMEVADDVKMEVWMQLVEWSPSFHGLCFDPEKKPKYLWSTAASLRVNSWTIKAIRDHAAIFEHETQDQVQQYL